MESVAIWIGVLGVLFALAAIDGLRNPDRWRFLWAPAAPRFHLAAVAGTTATAVVVELVLGVTSVTIVVGTAVVGLAFALNAIWLGRLG